MFAAWSRVRRSKQPAACARKVLLNRHLLERPSPDGPSRHTSRVIAAGTARWSHPQVRISGRGGQLPGTYQGRRGPRPVRRTVNGPGALSVPPGAAGWRDEQHPPKPEYEPFADQVREAVAETLADNARYQEQARRLLEGQARAT
jgi:hypothetical protein